MKTRHADTDDPAHAAERNLSSRELRPLTISLAVAAQAVRTYPRAAREACLWLANLAANSPRIQLCWQHRFLPCPLDSVGRITEVELCEKVGLSRFDVYAALTGHCEADLPRFVTAVSKVRENFESNLPPLATTATSGMIGEAFEIAGARHQITRVEGKTRHGKTEEAQRLWLKNLHDTVWVHCPIGGDERTFLTEFARALGVGANISKKPPQIRQQIKNALGIGLISRVVIDEAHKLWPKDPATQQPLRAEFVRELRDQLGVGFVLLTTDQFALAMEIAKQHNRQWAPGQLGGRQYQFVLPEAHTDREIDEILLMHAGNITKDALKGLCVFTQTEEGYLGVGIEALLNARLRAGNGSSVIQRDHVEAAIKQQRTNERVRTLALAARSSSKGKRTAVKLLAA
jgi:hypothetical protein